MEFLEIINLFSVLFIILFSGVVGWKRLKQGNASCILYGCYFIIFGVAQLFAFLLGTEFSFSTDVRLKSNILNIIVLLCLFIGENLVLQKTKMIRMPENNRARIIKKNNSRLSILTWTTLTLSICGFVLLIWAKGIPIGSLLSAEARTIYRLSGDWSGVILGNWLLSLVMISNYISLIKRKWVILGIGALLTLGAISLVGARAYIFYFIGPFLYYYIITNKRKIRFKNAIFVGAFIILFFIAFETVHLWRWQPERTPEAFLEQLFNKKTYSFLLSNPASELNYRIYNFQAVELFPRQHEWLYGNTYKNIFLFWLPSGITEGIKIDTMYKFADAVYGTASSYKERASIQPTFTGDCYINFGYLFWLPALIWGMGLAFIHIKARKNIFWNLLAGSSLVYFLALSFRGSIYLAFVQVIMCAIFLLCAIFILNSPYRFNYTERKRDKN